MIWNWNSFGVLGYAALAVALVVPFVVIYALVRRTKPIVLHVAVLLAVIALFLAEINSAFHVDRLEPDRSAEVAAAEVRKESRLEAIKEGRGSQVPKIQFAEDAKGDAIDSAGLDESDIKYLEKIEEEAAEEKTPEWKRQKKARGTAGSTDDSLEARLDSGDDAPAGVDAGEADPEAVRQPIVVTEAELATAHRVDRLSLAWARLLVLSGLAIIGIDWLRRANDYERAYLPLPLPSTLLEATRPLPAIVVRPRPPRRPIAEELAWLLRRGDSFVYLATGSAAADDVVAKLAGFESRRVRPVQILRVGAGGEACSDRFIFESLWYGRCSFVVDDPTWAERLMKDFCIVLKERQATRARTVQTVHVVWDLSAASASPSDPAAFLQRWKHVLQAVASLGKRAGFSVFLCRDDERSSEGNNGSVT
jgi:hypothetical protein